MGIIQPAELGQPPWQLNFSLFSLWPRVSQLMRPTVALDMAALAMDTTWLATQESIEVTEDIMAITVMATTPEATATCTRGTLRLSLRPMLDTPLDCPLTIVDTDMPPTVLDMPDTVLDMPHTVPDTVHLVSVTEPVTLLPVLVASTAATACTRGLLMLSLRLMLATCDLLPTTHPPTTGMVVPGAMSTEAPRAPEDMLVATTTVLSEAIMAVYMACTRGQLSLATSGGTTDLDAATRLCTGPTLATGQPSTTTKSSTPQPATCRTTHRHTHTNTCEWEDAKYHFILF